MYIFWCCYKDGLVLDIFYNLCFFSMVFLRNYFSVFLRAGFEAMDSKLHENPGPITG